MFSDALLPVLMLLAVVGLAAGVMGAYRRSTALMVFSGFLVLSATGFALTALVLA